MPVIIDLLTAPVSVSVMTSEQMLDSGIVRPNVKVTMSPVIVRGPPAHLLEQETPHEMPEDEDVVLMRQSENPIGSTGVVDGQLLEITEEVAVQNPSIEFLDSLMPRPAHPFESTAAARRINT